MVAPARHSCAFHGPRSGPEHYRRTTDLHRDRCSPEYSDNSPPLIPVNCPNSFPVIRLSWWDQRSAGSAPNTIADPFGAIR